MNQTRFEVYPSGEEFRFRLVVDNDNRLKSEGYTTKAACLNGIEAVKRDGLKDERYQLLESDDKKFYFNLRARNNEVIGTSQRFDNTERRQEEIDAIKHAAADAPVVDVPE